jgi:hypothetical protein
MQKIVDETKSSKWNNIKKNISGFFTFIADHSVIIFVAYLINLIFGGAVIALFSGENITTGYADFFLLTTATKNPLDYTNIAGVLYGFIVLLSGWLLIPLTVNFAYDRYKEVKATDKQELDDFKKAIAEDLIKCFDKGTQHTCFKSGCYGTLEIIPTDGEPQNLIKVRCNTCGTLFSEEQAVPVKNK